MSITQAEPACRQVLIVEDNADVREAVARALRLGGAHVRTTPSVGEALLFMEQSPPSHILLDLALPDAGGVIVLRAARRNHRGIRVALMTGSPPEAKAVLDAQRWQPDATFHKPVHLDRILAWLGCR
jgi:DNA-binding NtrC family response regulator